MSEELKPCPFCGGEAVQADTRFGYPAEHWVKCGYCSSCTTAYSNREAAKAAWNTRPAPKATGLVEADWLRGDWYEKWQDATEDADANLMATLEALRGRVEQIILAALKDGDVVLEEAAERAAFVAGYRAAHMVPDAYDSTSAAEEAWEGYRLVSRNLKERV